VDAIMQRVYVENASLNRHTPICDVPKLFDKARPVHEFVKVDIFLPGCPPPSKAILHAITALLEGRVPELVGFTRFGA
jgi:NAD-reducing hydrogenase small subunit